MSTFEMGGKQVVVKVDILTADRCKELTGVDVLDYASERPEVLQLIENPRLACSVVHACSDVGQDEEGMKWFASHWTGDVIVEGCKALWVALANFSPSHSREVIEAAMEETLKTAKAVAKTAATKLKEGKLTQAAIARVESLADEIINTSVEELSGNSAGSAPG